MSQPTLRVRDILTKTWRSTEEGDNVMAEVGLVVKSEALNPRTSRVHYELLSPADKTSATGYKDIKLNMRGEDTLRFLARIPDSLLWSPEKTTRFTLRVKTQHEGRYMEYIEVPLGFRTVEVQNGQLAVNGTPVTLRTREVPTQPRQTRSRHCADKGTTRSNSSLAQCPQRCMTPATRWECT